MSAPNISVVIEPSVGSSVVYEPVARNSSSGDTLGIVCLRLSITNNGGSQIHLNKVTLSFSSPPSVPGKVIPVPGNWPGKWLDSSGNEQHGSGVNIAPGKTYIWNSLRQVIDPKSNPPKDENDAAVFSLPAPKSMTLSLHCDGFSSPWKATKTLAAHTNPVDGGAYIYPAQFDDLREGEFWLTASDRHGTGDEGSQLFGYDMGVYAYDPDEKDLNRILPGKDGTKNSHYRVWGKRVHAMADGVVVHFLEGVEPNPKPGKSSDGPWQKAPWDDLDKAWSDHVGAGNHFYIQHGDEVALYAHMQKGTLNTKLLKVGAHMKAGDLLGLAGNAGSSSEPHLHIHAIKGTVAEKGPLRPLLFRNIFAIDPGELSFPSTSGPWARVDREGPPAVPSGTVGALIWPLGRNPEWRGWEDLGGPIYAPPAVASWATDRLDVFSAAKDGQLKHKKWDGSAWHEWKTLGGAFKSAPAAVSWGPNRIDVFVRGMDDHLGHLWWDGNTWRGWEDLGGHLTSTPAVASWGPHRLDVFAAGHDGQLRHKWWDGSTWHEWENLGGAFKDWPAAVSWGPHRIDVFVRGTDDHLGHLWWDGSQWKGWEDLGGNLTSGPAAASREANRLDVFAGRDDGQLNHKWWNGSKWSNWDFVGGGFQGDAAAVSQGPERIDVFVRGTDNHLGHLWKR